MESKTTETRQSWSYQEDKLLLELINLMGCTSWNKIQIELQSKLKNPSKIRSAAACRERYQNILNPNLNKSNWTYEEEQQLFYLQQSHGNSWAKIASKMPGRSDLLCKNFFYSTLRKVLRRLSKAVGLDSCTSDLLKQIKPSVLGIIYSVDDSLKLNINEEERKQIQEMINKYRFVDKQELRSLTVEESTNIKKLLNTLFSINNQYNQCKNNNTKKHQTQDITSLEPSKTQKKKIETDTVYSNEKSKQQLEIQENSEPKQSELVQQQSSLSYQSQYQTFVPAYTIYVQPVVNLWPIQQIQSPIQYQQYTLFGYQSYI